MPMPSAYRRAPMMDPVFVALPDTAVRSGIEALADRLLKMIDPENATELQAILATRLGGWETAPAMPDLNGLSPLDDLKEFTEVLTAAEATAFIARDREGVQAVALKLRELKDALPDLTEGELFENGADLLRLLADFYRRTGVRTALDLAGELRSRLPDVSGVCHSFPFESAFRPSDEEANRDYHERMARFATGRLAADTLAMSTHLAQFTGSGRDLESAKVGLAAMTRYHGLPGGAISAAPYLAGKNPSASADLFSVCALAEACSDALLVTGENDFADRLEMLIANALPELLPEEGGVRGQVTASALEASPIIPNPSDEALTALLKALCAIRRAQFAQPDDNTLAVLLPLKGVCTTRLNGEPVRVTVTSKGFYRREIKVKVECRQPLRFALRLRVPGYADGARLLLNGEAPQMTPAGQYAVVDRTWKEGDELSLQLMLTPRAERGFRGSLSYYCGETLLALPLPAAGMEWRYALIPGEPAESGTMEGMPCARVEATDAPSWSERDGVIAPPPQDVTATSAVTLTLMPAARFPARIAALPVCRG